jgi:hypothetical protein
MGAERTPLDDIDADGRSLLRLGGIAALLIAGGYLAIIPLYARVGAPPTGGEPWLRYLAGKTTVWWAILYLSVLTDVLFVPVALALYAALARVSRTAMLVAVSLVGLFVVLDLAVTWTSIGSLITLADAFPAAGDDAQRAAYVAAASYPAAVMASKLEVVYAIVTLSSGILIIGLVMLKGLFSRITALLGLITGVLGIAALSGVTAFIIGNALFATAWVLFTGYTLFRLGRARSSGPER